MSVRDEIVKRLVAEVKQNGLPPDLSLRQLAALAGTSHRMLQYHFGSREQALAAVMTTLRTQEQERFAQLARWRGRGEAVVAMWEYFSAPEQTNRLAAFFRVVGEATSDRKPYEDFLCSLDDWRVLLTELGEADGLSPEQARIEGRALNSALRGLLLDLSVTEARDDVHEAFQHMLQLFGINTATGDAGSRAPDRPVRLKRRSRQPG